MKPIRDDMLAARQGSQLTEGEAQQLEYELSQSPYDTHIRSLLLGYYTSECDKSDSNKQKRLLHSLWFVEHHPTSEIAGSFYNGLYPTKDWVGQNARRLWLGHVANNPDNPVILARAGLFLLYDSHDITRSITFLEQALSLEPHQTVWRRALAFAYNKLKDSASVEQRGQYAHLALEALEAAYQSADNIYDKRVTMEDMAAAAFDADEAEKAKMYATKLINDSMQEIQDADELDKVKTAYFYGTSLHRGNIILGRLALRNDDIQDAKFYLLLSGRTSGSAQISLVGPNMSLAKELLEQGEQQAVIEFIELCKGFYQGKEMDEWISQIKNNKMPDFGESIDFHASF